MKLPSTALAIVLLSGTFFWAQSAGSGESSQDLAICYNPQDLTLSGGNNPQDSPSGKIGKICGLELRPAFQTLQPRSLPKFRLAGLYGF